MRKFLTALLILIIAALILGFMFKCETETSAAVISTPQGPVQGVVTDNGIHNVMGIPFAAPPVGDLRWRPPAPAANWTNVRKADNFTPMCMQSTDSGDGFINLLLERHGLSKVKKTIMKKAIESAPLGPMSEDCLYLNIRTPNIDAAGKVKREALPVMVWIHGGGHQFGSADFDFYQGDALPSKGVVLITTNYRLGAFGYMAHPALSADDPRGVSGNYGVLDQIAALEWVRDNVSAYGGDPDNVTIFGESAGAWSVTEMITAPAAKGLFHKAIGQSGASTYHLGQMDGNPTAWISGYTAGKEIAKRVSLENPDAATLRAVPAEKIVQVVTEEVSDAFNHIRDGVVFPKNVGTAFQDGDFYSVPTLFGYNSDEATVFYPDDPQPTVWTEDLPREDRAAQIAALRPHFGLQTEKLIDLYGLDKDFDAGGEQMMGDEFFGANIRMVTRANEAKGSPAYAYIFARIPPNEKQNIGAYHIAEIPFVFGTPEKAFGWSKEDDALAELMQNYWVNFARTGNPNSEGLPNWPTYKGKNWMQLSANNDLETGAIQNFRGEKLDALAFGVNRKLLALRQNLDLAQTQQSTGGSGSQSAE